MLLQLCQLLCVLLLALVQPGRLQLQPLQAVLARLQFGGFARCVVALVGQRVGVHHGLFIAAGGIAQLHGAGLDGLPGGIALHAHLRDVGQGDRLVRGLVLGDLQVQGLDVGVERV